jgi:ribose 5-phosphate isomerase B
MKIAIGSDHRGYRLKELIKEHFVQHAWTDLGTDSSERVDYPDYAHLVCESLIQKKVDLAVLLCGSGIGMAIAANRYNEILAGNCWSPEVARLARAHDHINLLVLPADFVSADQAFEIIETWIQTDLLEGQYAKRIEKI